MPTSRPHILIVDDEQELRDSLVKFLDTHSFRASAVADGRAMRRIFQQESFDLVVLDLMLPVEDGFSLCQWLRAHSNLPIVMLTAMASEADRIVGLELGADDYVSKPFNPRELLARIKAVLRRSKPWREAAPAPAGIYRFAGWMFDANLRELKDDTGVIVPLSTAEYELLCVFVQRPQRVLSRDQLLDLCRGRQSNVFDRSIDTQVSRLRRKIERDVREPRLIKTVWGEGYVFTCDVTSG